MFATPQARAPTSMLLLFPSFTRRTCSSVMLPSLSTNPDFGLSFCVLCVSLGAFFLPSQSLKDTAVKVGVSESAALEVVAKELKLSLMWVMCTRRQRGGVLARVVVVRLFCECVRRRCCPWFPGVLRGRMGPCLARENEGCACVCSGSVSCLCPLGVRVLLCPLWTRVLFMSARGPCLVDVRSGPVSCCVRSGPASCLCLHIPVSCGCVWGRVFVC